MEQHSHLRSIFPELFLAITLDYTHDFNVRTDGTLYCMAYPAILFELNEVTIMPIRCLSHNATLYLVKTKEFVLKGTLIEYHEI